MISKRKPMLPWPRSSMTESVAFKNSALKYFGPLYLKYRKESVKTWVYLFIYFAKWATHLELGTVSSSTWKIHYKDRENLIKLSQTMHHISKLQNILLKVSDKVLLKIQLSLNKIAIYHQIFFVNRKVLRMVKKVTETQTGTLNHFEWDWKDIKFKSTKLFQWWYKKSSSH